MLKAFEIYLYICASLVSIIIIISLLAVLLNLGVYAYETCIGIGTFKKFLRKYHNEMKREKKLKQMQVWLLIIKGVIHKWI